jgi:DNA-binding NarL/FixJ family response regulator
MQSFSVAIADDHKTFRQALVLALSPIQDFRFVIEADNGRQLLSMILEAKPDVILLDIHMPEMNGIETLKLIKNHHPDVRVLMLSAFQDEIFILQCLQYGINGYLTKSMEVSEVSRAIKAAYRNEIYYSNCLNNAFMRNYALKHGKTDEYDLPIFTNEEIRILEFLRDEVPTEDISKQMCMSKRSIEIKRDKMREKAKTRTVSGLILYALKRGLLQYSLNMKPLD